MMQSELLLPTSNFPFSTYQNNTLNDQGIDLSEILDGVFFSSFASSEDTSMVSSEPYFPDIFPKDLFDHDNMMITSDDDGFQKISRNNIDDICDWIYSSHESSHIKGTSSSAEISAHEWSPSPSLELSQNTQLLANMPINLPRKDIKLDNELSLLHLLRAYGEAMDDGNVNKGSLVKVIVHSINEKSSPHGNLVERVAYHMFKSKEDDDGEYLRQESIKNFVPALNVLYQSLICGRFAHYAANAAILESIPDDVTILHIVDFDIGEGIQWPALMEALGRKQKTVRLTVLKQEGKDFASFPFCWEFRETKKRLHDHARQYGLKMYIEEKRIEDFSEEMRRRRKKFGRGEDWLVFNCMAALPHMGRRRRRVAEFLKVAEELLANFDGILTFGDGEAGDGLRTCNNFEAYFEKLFTHYRSMFEALACNLPGYLEARMAMEYLFLAPFMRPVEWFEEWKEMAKSHEFEGVLEGRRASPESLVEAKVMVDEREDWYNVRIEGMRENEMVLRWKESVLVRVSTFCSRR